MKNCTIPLFFGLFMFFLQVLIYLAGIQLKPGELADTDCYMRLVRVEELTRTHEWFDHTIERSNAPFGETSHWGRLMDVLIIALALPFSAVLSSKHALFCSGVLISPLLLVFSGFAMMWASKPLFKNASKIEPPHLLLLYFSQASVILFFQAGRSDHHSLLILAFILSLGFLFRLLQDKPSSATAIGCGLIQALAFSVSLEFITVIVLTLGILVLAWISRHLQARTGLVFSGSLLGFCLLFYLIEQKTDQLAVIELDRMTSPHLFTLALATVYWLLVTGWEHLAFGIFPTKNIKALMTGRALITLVYGLLSALLLFNLFPALLRGPYGQMEPRLNELWLKHVMEVQTLWQTDPGGITTLFIWLSPALIVLPAGLTFLLRKKLPSEYRTWPWGGVLAASLLFTLLTLYQIRWAAYAQTALIFPLCAVLGELLWVTGKKLSPAQFLIARLAILLFFCAGYVPIAVLSLGPKLLTAAAKIHANNTPNTSVSTDLQPLAEWLEENPEFAEKERILAHLDFGPELLYRTRHEVIATPYHRNGSGILFFYDLMNEASEEKVLSQLRERGVTLILLEPGSSEKAFVNQSGLTDTFYRKLVQGYCPAFLKPLEVPEKSREAFRLYRVTN